MILIDTSVWIDHFRSNDTILFALLEQDEVLIHPVTIGELLLGGLSARALQDLLDLPRAVTASDEEVLEFIRRNALAGSGVGYADSHLLASTRLTPDTTLWTRDKRLRMAAQRFGLDADVEPLTGFQE